METVNQASSDIQLIEAILAGDIQKYGVLVGRYERLVFALALRMLRHREDAEEVAQDVFVKTFQKLQTFNGDAKFSSWLYRVMYNKSLDMLSKKKRSKTKFEVESLPACAHYEVRNGLEQMQLE